MAKSAAERAQENVDLGTAKVARLQKQLDGIKPKFDRVTAELAEAKTDLEFAQKHPALEGGAAQPAVVESDDASPSQVSSNFEANESDEAAQAVEGAGLASGVAVVTNDTGKSETVVPALSKPEGKKSDLFDQDDPFAN